ncbi:MAG TPA: 16S rRNA (guanine(966)-N(2))-methyltransferase RsmD [Candidatus Eremiobacteraceae bacterium]|nr:16S rRNA (guanine(966)-N(2))-methyltransferase RsmD [Candidatus Eremiobacteraceae bacterium]
MRLSGGTSARRVVAAPRGERTRPTSAKVREALFAVLGKRVQGARVLDLFAGSGALGLEAISRGAASVVFVESDAAAAMTVRRNAVAVIGDKERFRIMPITALRALRRLRGAFDIVLIDPPYDRGAREELVTLMQRSLVTPDGMVVVEHRSSEEVAFPASLRVLRSTKYGDTALTFASVVPGRDTAPQAEKVEAAREQPRARQKSRRSGQTS